MALVTLLIENLKKHSKYRI